MKILHVLEYSVPRLVGYTIRSKYIIENQKKQGLEPVVITSPIMASDIRDLHRYETIDGTKYYRTGFCNRIQSSDNIAQRLVKRYAYSKQYLKAIIEVARLEKPDILHAHSSYLNGVRGTQAAKHLGIPSVFEVRGLWGDTAVAVGAISARSWKYKFVTHMELKAMRNADGVVAIAESLKRHLIVNQNLHGKKIWVVPNGVDPDIFRPQPKDIDIMRELKLDGRTVFGFIGSVGAIEGLDIAIRAFAEIKEKQKTAFLLVGDGNDLPRLKEMIKQYNLGDTFIITGRVPHEEVGRYYSVMDALVYPRIDSNVNNRVTPLKPLEAMSMGKMVIASDVEGLKELVHDEVNGILFKRDDPRDLASKIKRMIGDKIDFKEAGSKAREWVLENRQWENSVRKYHNIYRAVMN